MIFLNYTPHDINIMDLPAINSSGLARVSETIKIINVIDDVEIITKELGAVTGLPDPEVDTFLIVSLMVAQALPSRTDLLIPGVLTRDEGGRIIGCENLCRI